MERYQILQTLRSTPNGSVHRALDRNTGMQVALKKTLASPNLEQELSALESLRIQGLPLIIEHYRDGSNLTLVSEFIEGISLQQRTNWPVAEAVDYTIRAARILEVMHGQRPRPILHRDVKPANLILRDQQLWLVDLGSAASPAQEARTLVSSVGYAPAEFYRGRLTTRSDQYSLAVTLNYLLSGQPPLPLRVESLNRLRPDLPYELSWLVQRASQAEQEDRFDSMAEFRQRLEGWLQDQAP